MSVSPYDGPDRFFHPVTIDSTNNSLVFKDDANNGNAETGTVSEGTYWVHNDAAIDSEYSSLLIAIKDTINGLSDSNNNYVFQNYDSSGSSLNNESVKLVDNDNTHTFELQFGDSNFTLNPKFFGFDPTTSSTKSSSNNELQGEVSVGGVWQTPKQKADARRNPRGDIFSSHRSPDSVNNAWEFVDDRKLKYHQIAAAHVYRDRGKYSDYASEAGLVQGDENNTFEELWRGFRRGEVLALYGKGGDSNNLLLDPANWSRDRTEAITMREDHTKKLKEHLGRVFEYASEYYDVEFQCSVQTSTNLPGYSH